MGQRFEGIHTKKEVTVNREDETGKISIWSWFDEEVQTDR